MTSCDNPSNGRYASGCRCDACRAAHAMAYNVREMRKARGEVYFVDVEPVRERLAALYALGYTRRELDRLGVSRSNQYHIMNLHPRTGRPVRRVRKDVADAVFAVSGRSLSKHQLVPADAARVLLQGWKDKGVTIAQVVRVTGISRHSLDDIFHGRVDTVRAETLVALLSHKTEIDETVVYAREAV